MHLGYSLEKTLAYKMEVRYALIQRYIVCLRQIGFKDSEVSAGALRLPAQPPRLNSIFPDFIASSIFAVLGSFGTCCAYISKYFCAFALLP